MALMSKETKIKISQALQGRKTWNTGMKGYTNGGSFKKGDPKISAENSYNWKGNNVGYVSLHKWVYKILGDPKKCEFCGINEENRKYYWANKSREYKRKENDWIRLCMPCHIGYDNVLEKVWMTRRQKYA